MALTIYGSPRSRTMRVLWAAAELGLDYDLVRLEWDDPKLKQSNYLAINRAGTIPSIVDGDFALAESLAINMYLAKSYGKAPFYPSSPEGEAEVWRWSLWAQAHLEPWVHKDVLPDNLRTVMDAHMPELIIPALAVLNSILAEQPWLLGDDFTVADLNVASVLSPSRSDDLDFTPYTETRDWLNRCHRRPARIATQERYKS